jgi:putative acetyltransferase
MIRVVPASLTDAPRVLDLYRAAAASPSNGLARSPEEYSLTHIENVLREASATGVVLLALDEDATLLGMIDAMKIGPRQFDHVLSNLTVVVHPDAQGRGVGTLLFNALFEASAKLTPKITRFELMAREGNTGAIRLYERLGFKIEGRFEARVRLPDGSIEADIAMGKLV